jgi:hypothetical protein
MSNNYDRKQLAALQAVTRAVDDLAAAGHEAAVEHLAALDFCRDEIEAIEHACRVAMPDATAVGARALVGELLVRLSAAHKATVTP